jgi:hypothetical protein
VSEQIPEETLEQPDEIDDELAEILDKPPEPEYHTILEIWREVLLPANELKGEKVSPQYATKMVSMYPGMTYRDVPDLQERYYDKISELLKILKAEIRKDADCLTWTNAADDATYNTEHYKDLLRDWQLRFLAWELDWDTRSSDAAIELAAISEVHKMFFGQTGLTQFLDNIKLEYTEADQAALAEALQELRESRDVHDE